jgi:hypothetical protein
MKNQHYTEEEVRQRLFSDLRFLCNYWARQTDSHPTEQERMEGLIFSILVIFDGGTGFPAKDIRLAPHKDDKAYYIENGEKYYKPNMLINNCQLHEGFVKK